MAWSGEQIQNAALIYQVGRSMGMSTRDIQIGLMAAMVESNLVNVHYGDRDSLGLFQQRSSWGSEEQRLNPRYAAQKFFSSLKALGDRRNTMNMGAAAQAVQRSAYPDRYAQRIGDVRTLWPRISSAAGDTLQSMDGGPYKSQPTMRFSQSEPQPQSVDFGTADDALGLPATDVLDAWDTTSPIRLDSNNTQAALVNSKSKSYMPLVSQGTNEAIIKPMAETSGGYEKGVNGWRKAVVEYAQRYVGTPYVWGGTSPSGFDCSGFIQYVMGKAGKQLPRISYQQANAGKRVGLNQLRPGDLVAWDNSSRNNGADHIAIYLGNGQIIEAPRPGLSVRIRKLGGNEGAWGVSLG